MNRNNKFKISYDKRNLIQKKKEKNLKRFQLFIFVFILRNFDIYLKRLLRKK